MIRKLFDGLKLYKFGTFRIIFNRLFPDVLTYQTFFIYSFDFREDTLQAINNRAFSVKRVYNHQEDLFKQFRQKFPASAFLSRIKQQNRHCYLALKRGDVAGYAWIARQELAIDCIHYTYPLKDDEIFIYSCFVSKENRGEGIYPAMLRKILDDYSVENSMAYIGVLSSNKGSARGIEKAGFKKCGCIRYIKWFDSEKWMGLQPLSHMTKSPSKSL